MSRGDGSPVRFAAMLRVMNARTALPCLRAVCATVITRSAKRSPRSLCVPKLRVRHKTKARSSRSAWLFVGSTPSFVTIAEERPDRFAAHRSIALIAPVEIEMPKSSARSCRALQRLR